MAYTAKQTLYLTEDGKVVKEGDPEANTLLVAAGGTLPDAVAAEHQLTGGDAEEPEAEEKAIAKAPEDKAVHAAPAKK
jgi:hypothetical protein